MGQLSTSIRNAILKGRTFEMWMNSKNTKQYLLNIWNSVLDDMNYDAQFSNGNGYGEPSQLDENIKKTLRKCLYNAKIHQV